MANVLLEIFSAIFQGYCLQYFYGSFLECRIWNRRINGLVAAIFYGVLRLELGGFMSTISVMTLIFYKGRRKISIFLIVIFGAISEISVFFAYTVGQIGEMLIFLWGWCVERGYILSADVLSVIVHITVMGTIVLKWLVWIVFLYCPLKNVVRVFREKTYDIGNVELLFLTVPSLIGILLCNLLRTILITMEDGVQRQMYDRYPLLMVIVPSILLLSLISIVSGVKLFQNMVCWNREKSSRIVLEKQVSSLQEHIGEMERVYSGIRGMKHDMKNTLAVIMQLVNRKEENREKELQAYLEELNQTMDRLEFRFKTGNTVVDTLLNMKYHESIHIIPDLQMDVEGMQFPEKLYIQSYDIGIILGNALDNAIEACQKLKAKEPDTEVFIYIHSFQKRELFFLKVENSFDGQLVQKLQGEFPVTDKIDKKSHGIGLVNIKNTAEKYQGTMDFKVNGKVFILSVMMKNERRSEDRF